MINLITSDNIFENKKIVLNYLVSNSAMDIELDIGSVKWMRLELSGENNDEQFDCFYEGFLTELSAKYFNTYFFYSEEKKQLKTRARSYTKLFYGLRKGKIIREGEYVEKEIDFEGNKSILAGIIQIDKLDYFAISERLNLSTFRFGLGVSPYGGGYPEMNLNTLISKVNKGIFREDKLVSLNYLDIIKTLLTPNSFIYSYLYDGKDDLIFTVYCGKAIYPALRSIVLNNLPKEEELVEKKVASKETDDLIQLYFNDWRFIEDKK